MTAIRVRCSSCEKVLKAPESARGKKVKCSCGHVFRIPEKKASTASSAPGPPPRPAPPKRTPPPRPKQDVVEDFEEVVDDYDDLGGMDEYDDYEDDYAPMPARRRKSASGGRRPAKQKGSGGVWGFISGENRLLQALADHEAETGERYELIKAGIPPLRLWIKNRKGDKWGLVADERGRELWVRHRVRIFTSGPPLAFFD